jgi:hypothetical protein
MTARKITEYTNGERRAVVRYNVEYEEYVVQLFVNGTRNYDADYFTNDRDDAISTMRAMVEREGKQHAS